MILYDITILVEWDNGGREEVLIGDQAINRHDVRMR